MINLPLALSGPSASDPHWQVDLIRMFFNVPVRPVTGISLNDTVRFGVRSTNNNPIPNFHASFEDQANSGTDLTIEFFEPQVNKDRYTFDFGHPEVFVDLDDNPLTGNGDFGLQVLRGDVDNNETVVLEDVLFVHDRIG